MKIFSNREIRIISSLSWIILTATFFWRFKSIPIIDQLVWQLILCLLIASIAKLAIKVNMLRIDLSKSKGTKIDVYAGTYRARSLIETEQKRIGEEIHDLISGRLFSVVCATSVLMRSVTIMEKDREQLQLITSTVNQALSDLRSIIYSLYSVSNEKNISVIRRYLKETEKLHGINVSLLINDDCIHIGGQELRALYRIICESTNNAIQHGQCNNLSVEIISDGSDVCLIICDDGLGFDPHNTIKEDWGMGLNNIRKLTEVLNGLITIESKLGQGTQIRVLIPNKKTDILKVYKEEAS